MSKRQDVPRRECDDERWCSKLGVIVVNGRCTDVPVWVSGDGALVLPVGGGGRAKAEVGSRIRMSRRLWLICDRGELGRVTGVRGSPEDTPGSWFVRMDNGRKSYIFEGEFEVVPELATRQPVRASSIAPSRECHTSEQEAGNY